MRQAVRDDVLFGLTALTGGALLTLALAPFDLWIFALLSPALLFASVFAGGVKSTLIRFYLFNVAMFGTGVSWIWVSVHEHGDASILLATFLVTLLVLAYSSLCLPLAYVYARYFRGSSVVQLLGFCGLWVLQEWIRTWFLTGFPWMYAGYGVMNTPLLGIAPIGGIFSVSLAVVVIGATLALVVMQRKWVWLVPPLLLVMLALGLGRLTFTTPADEISVSLIQGNIDQRVKWNPQMRGPILRRYVSMSADEWGRDLIVWPEAAITVFKDDAQGFLAELDAQGKASGTAVLMGIPDQSDDGRFQNTVLMLGVGEGQYIKRRLVPFGEYVPLEGILRGVIKLFDLPMARNMTGPMEQTPLRVQEFELATLICYEIIYPSLVRSGGADPDFLVTVSNDTWFGRSIGPHQHFQMARMRAIELGRDLVRGTNSGITAVVDAKGVIKGSLPQFEASVLRQNVTIRTGKTPYMRFGDLPVLLICFLILALGAVLRLQNPRNKTD